MVTINESPPPVTGPATGRRAVLRPPIVVAAAIGAGVVLQLTWPLSFTSRAAREPIGLLLSTAGLALFAAAIREFRAAGTPVPGTRATTMIVRSGPYRFSRHPIYLSFALLHLGVAAWFGSWWLLLTFVVSSTWIAVAIVPREERYLETHFGSTYAAYQSSVRRWLALSTLLVIIIVAAAGLSFDRWRGGGFSAAGPEMPRLRQVLNLTTGMSVADVGAGGGDLTLALAAEVGSGGQVFSSDIDPDALDLIRGRVAAAGLRNVTVVQASAGTTGLPASCCDAIVLRRVYHHLSDPAATNADLLRSMRPGAALVIIDFPPTWLWPWPAPGVPKDRNGHGVTAAVVVGEVTASGFELVHLFDDWPGRGPLGSYCAVFRKTSTISAAGLESRSH